MIFRSIRFETKNYHHLIPEWAQKPILKVISNIIIIFVRLSCSYYLSQINQQILVHISFTFQIIPRHKGRLWPEVIRNRIQVNKTWSRRPENLKFFLISKNWIGDLKEVRNHGLLVEAQAVSHFDKAQGKRTWNSGWDVKVSFLTCYDFLVLTFSSGKISYIYIDRNPERTGLFFFLSSVVSKKPEFL